MEINNHRGYFTDEEMAAIPWNVSSGLAINGLRKHLEEWINKASSEAERTVLRELQTQVEVYDLEELFKR